MLRRMYTSKFSCNSELMRFLLHLCVLNYCLDLHQQVQILKTIFFLIYLQINNFVTLFRINTSDTSFIIEKDYKKYFRLVLQQFLIGLIIDYSKLEIHLFIFSNTYYCYFYLHVYLYISERNKRNNNTQKVFN